MSELTAEVVRTIVGEAVQGLRQDLRQEMRQEFANMRQEFVNGLNQVLATVQSFHDEDQDDFAGLNGRLRNHNERIAKLERLSNLRT